MDRHQAFTPNFLEQQFIGPYISIASMWASGVCFFIVTLIIDPFKTSKHLMSNNQTDDDYMLTVEGISKYYDDQLLLKDVSFQVKKNEVLGILGPNGSGKSTLMKILALETQMTQGCVNLTNTNHRLNGSDLGVCGQEDIIWDNLTVDDHLLMIAAIKGVRNSTFQKKFLKSVLGMMGDIGNIKAGQLSGGNKRKLSCIMALIGNPRVLLLDEPTTNIDLVSRRSFYKLIKKLSDTAVVITTHNMEEAEALCDKMAVMIDGTLKNFGSLSDIYDRYGQGYLVIIVPSPESGVIREPLPSFLKPFDHFDVPSI